MFETRTYQDSEGRVHILPVLGSPETGITVVPSLLTDTEPSLSWLLSDPESLFLTHPITENGVVCVLTTAWDAHMSDFHTPETELYGRFKSSDLIPPTQLN